MTLMMNDDPVHLAFVTDGDNSQILGISLVLRSLRPRLANRTSAVPATVWVAAPVQSHEKSARWLQSASANADFRFLPATPRGDDRYFVQLFLVDVFEQISASQVVTCLDYDHVILDAERFPIDTPSVGVTVSSELRKDVANDVLQVFGDQPNLARLNTSLLAGTAASLRGVGKHWVAAYREMRSVAPKRYLAETSFGLAALRAHTLVSPCSPAVQGNFANPTRACFAFHYGGEYNSGMEMKRVLREQADVIPPSGPTGEDLDQITRALQAVLIGGLSVGKD